MRSATEMTYTAIASHIKKHMTNSHTGVYVTWRTFMLARALTTLCRSWHVIVGRNFCGSLTHQENNAAYLYFGQTGVLCFRTV